ncbi:unnamed protein product [Ectocarpus sp. 4 AP-2014]
MCSRAQPLHGRCMLLLLLLLLLRLQPLAEITTTRIQTNNITASSPIFACSAGYENEEFSLLGRFQTPVTRLLRKLTQTRGCHGGVWEGSGITSCGRRGRRVSHGVDVLLCD